MAAVVHGGQVEMWSLAAEAGSERHARADAAQDETTDPVSLADVPDLFSAESPGIDDIAPAADAERSQADPGCHLPHNEETSAHALAAQREDRTDTEEIPPSVAESRGADADDALREAVEEAAGITEGMAAAEVLEAVARRVRRGDIPVAHGVTQGDDAAVLAAVLASLLGARI